MAERDRLGAEVRAWTRRIAALMRTPDEGLEAFALDQGLPEGVTVGELQQLRALLDELAAGMDQPSGAAFWSRLGFARDALVRGAPAPAAPPAVAPSDLRQTAGLPSAAPRARSVAPPRDFRGELVGPPPAPSSKALRDDWRPASKDVEPPFDAQEWTMGLEESAHDGALDHATVKLDAVQGPLEWTVERVAAMTVAVRRNRAYGEPSIEAICAQLGVADRASLEVAWHLWQQRLRENADLARRHQALVRAWSVP